MEGRGGGWNRERTEGSRQYSGRSECGRQCEFECYRTTSRVAIGLVAMRSHENTEALCRRMSLL